MTVSENIRKLLMIIVMVVALITTISINSYAFQGGPGSAPTVSPMLPPPDGGGGGSDLGDLPVLVPLNCKDEEGFSKCYHNKSLNCANEPELP